MKCTRILILSFVSFVIIPRSSFPQEYSYNHFDVTEGLAGSTVYCLAQDKEGFIWMGTETGLSRFDGTHFRNFTSRDGLPDMEILQLFADSKGRVWMAPFRRAVCYYYQGRIHNQVNDPTLTRIRLKENIENFAEDSSGNILIQTKSELFLYGMDSSIERFDSINGQPLAGSSAICRSPAGNFLVQERDSVYELSRGHFTASFSMHFRYNNQNYIAMTPDLLVWTTGSKLSPEIGVRSMSTGNITCLPYSGYTVYQHRTYYGVGDSLVYDCGSSGATELNLHTGDLKNFLEGIEVARCLRDDEGNLWFATIGQGVYLLSSELIRNIYLHAPPYDRCAVYSITRYGDTLFAGTNHHVLFTLLFPQLKERYAHVFPELEKERILYLDKRRDAKIAIGSDMGIEKYGDGYWRGPRTVSRRPIGSIKATFRKNDREVLFATSFGVFLVDQDRLRIVDSLWHERATALFLRNDSLFIGTLNGLYLVKRDRSAVFLGGEIPFFRKRIAAMAGSSDGTLWVASYDDAGIAGYRSGKIVATITAEKQGLTSNFCRTLFVHDNCLWVGTDKGLNKIDLSRQGHPVTRYTSYDGLGSDIINTLYFDSSTVYVGTPAGISFFDENKASVPGGCRLSLLAVTISDKNRIADSAGLALHFNNNNIRFDYAGISYKSVGNIYYRYRLVGLDSNWKSTRETFLDYPSLPEGNYEFQLLAINKFGVESKPLLLHFSVAPPFWRTGWFTGLALILFLSLTWLLVTLRIRVIRRRQEEKDMLGKRILDTEHMALRAQMNPHFIFNCLNSIQQFVFDRDIISANKYISGFAKLIRATLQYSTASYISLSDEMDYLSTYLSLEKLRFEDKMDYSIEVDPSLSGQEIFIPPMLIQPYVENSMRHGLRHKQDGKGHIRISVHPFDDKITCIIEDNGIGRKNAAKFKTREHIEYQSRGMSLTGDRIRLINTAYGNSIRTEVIDLEDEGGRSTGTRVILEFSEFFINNPKVNSL
jgi:ligand-binding sensor domain-containing protein